MNANLLNYIDNTSTEPQRNLWARAKIGRL